MKVNPLCLDVFRRTKRAGAGGNCFAPFCIFVPRAILVSLARGALVRAKPPQAKKPEWLWGWEWPTVASSPPSFLAVNFAPAPLAYFLPCPKFPRYFWFNSPSRQETHRSSYISVQFRAKWIETTRRILIRPEIFHSLHFGGYQSVNKHSNENQLRSDGNENGSLGQGKSRI